MPAEHMVTRLQAVAGEGNLRRIRIKNRAGRTLIEIPMTLGLLGPSLRQAWTALGALAATAPEFAVEVQREHAWPRDPTAAPRA